MSKKDKIKLEDIENAQVKIDRPGLHSKPFEIMFHDEWFGRITGVNIKYVINPNLKDNEAIMMVSEKTLNEVMDTFKNMKANNEKKKDTD